MTFDQLIADLGQWYGIDASKLHPYYLDELREMTNSQRATAAYLLTAAQRAAEVPLALGIGHVLADGSKA